MRQKEGYGGESVREGKWLYLVVGVSVDGRLSCFGDRLRWLAETVFFLCVRYENQRGGKRRER